MTKDWRATLRTIINERGLSLRELSLRLGQSEGYMKVLLGRSNEPGLGTLQKICNELGVPVSALIDDIPADQEAIIFARAFSRLTAEEKAAVRTIMRTLGKSQNDS